MNDNRVCKIVKDLLPNYIEDLTNEETNNFIEEHLKICVECQNDYDNMRKNIVLNNIKIDNREIKYAKKFNEKLKIFKVIAIILLIIALVSVGSSYLYVKNEYKNMEMAFNKSMEINNVMATEGRYPDTFYATIEEIYDLEIPTGIKMIKVKGWDKNEKSYRGEYNIQVILDNVGDNFKIIFDGNDILFDELKVGHNIAVYNYGDIPIAESCDLTSIRKIVVIDDKL